MEADQGERSVGQGEEGDEQRRWKPLVDPEDGGIRFLDPPSPKWVMVASRKARKVDTPAGVNSIRDSRKLCNVRGLCGRRESFWPARAPALSPA